MTTYGEGTYGTGTYGGATKRGHFEKHDLNSPDHVDVDGATVPDVGEALIWNGALWSPGAVGSVHDLFGPEHADVDISSPPAVGDVLKWTGSVWDPSSIATGSLNAVDIAITDAGANYVAGNVEAALAEEADARQAHEADAVDAHDASAISLLDAGANFVAGDVEAALAEEADARQAHEANSTVHGGSTSSGVLFPSGGPLAGTTPVPATGQAFYDENTNIIWVYDAGWLGVEVGGA